MIPRLTRTGALYLNDNSNVFVTEDVRILLVSNSATFDPTAEFVSDIVADEVTNDEGTGYERKAFETKSRGIELAVSVPEVGTRDIIKFNADDLSYTNINTNERIGAGYIFVQETDDSDSPVLGMIDLESDIPSDVVTLPTVTIAPSATLGWLYNVIL